MIAKKKPKTVPAVRSGRIARFRKGLKLQKLSAALITNPTDYHYLTGFTGEDSALLVLQRQVHLISDGRFDEAINRECPWVTRWMRKGTLDDEIAAVIKNLGPSPVGIQANHISVASMGTLKRKRSGAKFEDLQPILPGLRRLKDPDELKSMRKAIRVAQESFLAMRETIRIGDTELTLAARLEYEMKSRGSTNPAFPTIVAEGPNAALPHAHPGRRKVKKGSAILFDWGACVEGYCSDLTRMVFVGSIPPRIGEVYNVVLKAQLKAIAAVGGGARLCDVDAAARLSIRAAGYAKEFSHALGHGLGLDVHESPRVSWQSGSGLEPGCVVTIEPGVYLPGIGGVRIEDDVLVTERGCRVLSRLSKSAADSVIKARLR